MSDIWFFGLLQFSVIASALVSGIFLAFSDFIMKSLNTAQTAAGVEVMQVINREVWGTVFMFLLKGMSVLSPLLVAYAYFQVEGIASVFIMAGGVIYFIGVLIVSLVFNIPMNDNLEAKEHTSIEAATYWKSTYVSRWSYWNYVRAISAAVAAFCYLFACVAHGAGLFVV